MRAEFRPRNLEREKNWRQERKREEAAQQEAADKERRHTETHARQERKRRQKEEARTQQREREWRNFQPAHGVGIPKTTPPSETRFQSVTLVSALDALSP